MPAIAPIENLKVAQKEGLSINAMLYAPCALRYFEVTMPAIASLEELKMVQRDFRSMFLVVTPNDLRLTIYGNILTLCTMPACRRHGALLYTFLRTRDTDTFLTG